MKLTTFFEVLDGIPELKPQSRGDLRGEITGLSYHSGSVNSGDMFACLVGMNADGHDYAAEAVERGARALLVERFLDFPPGILQLRVSDPRLGLAHISEHFFGNPTRDLTLIGVTGTSGKTTTSSLIRHILEGAGIPTGYVGTLGTVIGGKELPGSLTTPEAPDLCRAFAAMRDSRDRAAVMEVSSHSLVFERVAACDFDIALFTNLAPEHLDFHDDLEDYARAKAILFSYLGNAAGVTTTPYGVVNADDPMSQVMREACPVDVLEFGLEGGDILARDIDLSLEGSRFQLQYPDGSRVPVSLKLPARYNVYNATAAAAAAYCLGISGDLAASTLASATPVSGRFEVISGVEGDPMVVVDFAHTPDELENLLTAVAELTAGRIIVVFGCGGDRDRSKRPIMGRMAAELGDYAIVSSDNPRSEDPECIAREVAEGIPAGAAYEIIVDRGSAIERAIDIATSRDVVVIAGKGHETYQIFEDRTVDFDDREVARSALKGKREGRH
ncbi:MAG: UDP-N-acetylmuramoyl-L-alanyl-D-glutamate--2,6-diaminopimelate ligase [Bacillota bacterium]